MRSALRRRAECVPNSQGGLKTQSPTGELVALITTITGWEQAPAAALAEACHQRWEHEAGSDQLTTHLRGPGRVLRSNSPDMIRQEI